MRKIIGLTIVALTLVACTKTPKDSAEELIEKAVKPTLYDPESYEARETVLDSAFSPLDSPELMDKVEKIQSDKNEMAAMHNQLDSLLHAKVGKAEITNLTDKMESLTATIQKESKDLIQFLQTPRKFIGFRAFHTYRAKIKSEEPEVGHVVVFFDPDILIIQRKYDAKDLMEKMQMLKEFQTGTTETKQEEGSPTSFLPNHFEPQVAEPADDNGRETFRT